MGQHLTAYRTSLIFQLHQTLAYSEMADPPQGGISKFCAPETGGEYSTYCMHLESQVWVQS